MHFYLGLYFLFFTWLFAFTGLILNHSWKFAEFYPNRKIATLERKITPAAGLADVGMARDLTRQLEIRGEISMSASSSTPELMEFTVSRPGKVYQVTANLKDGKARVVSNEYNTWGMMHVLHTFTGVTSTSPRQSRDWVLTSVWVLAMDALALGLIVMVLSSYFMWWVLPQKRVLGGIVLGVGCITCSLFVFGLRWIYR